MIAPTAALLLYHIVLLLYGLDGPNISGLSRMEDGGTHTSVFFLFCNDGAEEETRSATGRRWQQGYIPMITLQGRRGPRRRSGSVLRAHNLMDQREMQKTSGDD